MTAPAPVRTAAGLPERLERALDAASAQEVLAWVRAAEEKQRRAAFAEVVAHQRRGSSWREWRVWQARNVAYAVALAGCASTAKKAATALNRGDMAWTFAQGDPAPVVEALRLRAVPWTGELAHLLAAKLPTEGGNWPLVYALTVAGGGEPPASEQFVAGWIDRVRESADPDAELRDGPYTALLLPLLFTHDRLGSRLDYTYGARGFLPALMRLGEADPAVRVQLLDGCRARLLRGGRPGELRGYLRMHDELAPAPAEVAPAAADYVRLVEGGNPTVAGMAQRALRDADEAGLLDWDTVRDVAATALARPEKILVKTQTAWLRRAARRRPEHAAEIRELLAPPEPEAVPVPVALPVPVPAPLGPALDGLPQVTEELSAMLAGDWSVPTVERVLAGIAHWRVHDQDALARAVRPLVDGNHPGWGRLAEQLRELLLTVVVAPGRSARWRQLADVFRDGGAVPVRQLHQLRVHGNGLHLVLAVRLAEMSVQLGRRPAPVLMATPTHASGLLEPEVLLRRLEQAERDGWQPWAADLDQALLRLPREVDRAVATAALRLRSPAGAAFAHWISGPVPDPVSLRQDQTPDGKLPRYSWERQPALRRVVVVEPPEHVSPLMRELLTVSRGNRPVWAAAAIEAPEQWTAALPSHREVVAAAALPSLAALADLDHEGGGVLLAQLAEVGGPAGPAVHLALAYGLAARSAADRVGAVDGLLGLAATGDLDGSVLGRELGELAAAGVLKVNRVASALNDAAAAGAVSAVWQTAAAALVPLSALDKARPGTADLMAVAARCARASGATGLPPELAALAARGGSSRLVAEARELQAALSA
ncbi:hypothetical protein CS0771_00850 [Catellatospora sp. IY07-71]|uniref:hypothetical protein n=1 Tax=Catellatospora sp. IY07-71 TaxID=2728827 RepID=UPI001BB327EC|nr:hypothetical protein [Catellatospora sp. IY07-71]BCJ70541.1 hypothetical protein CS0771_00850 [Catellatospora sp. IY07-71]